MKRRWTTIGLVIVGSLLLGFLLTQRGVLRPAEAQSEGVVGRVIVAMGTPRDRFVPIVVVDTVEQSLVVYQYRYLARTLQLASVRTYRYDKQLPEYNNDREGVSVNAVRARVEQMGGAPR